MPARAGIRSVIVLAASLMLAGAAAAQSPTLIESYGRVTTLVNYMTAYVGELLLACAAYTAIVAAIESGSYDLSGNAEFVNLLKVNP